MKNRSHIRWLALVGTLALLAGCNTNNPSKPSGPVVNPKALINGAVSSPVYEALKTEIAMTVNDGSQEVSNYDLVMVDGDNFTGQQLKVDKVIESAIRSGKWVLALDMAEDDKHDGLGAWLGASIPGDSPAYLVRQSRNPKGTLVNTFIDLAGANVTTSQRAQTILNYVQNPGLSTPKSDTDVPGRVVHILFQSLTPFVDVKLPKNNNPTHNLSSGTALWNVAHYVHLFLDANNNPYGNFQHMLIRTEGLASPIPLVSNDINNCPQGDCELAWIQTQFRSSYQITSDQTGGLVPVSTSPTTTNSATTITTGTSFNIGFNQSQGGFGSFTYSNSVTRTIADWAMNNQTSVNGPSWQYIAQNTNGDATYDGNNTNSFDPNPWQYSLGFLPPMLKPANALSMGPFQYTTESYWVNSQVSKDSVVISGTDTAWYTDAYVVSLDKDNLPNGNSTNFTHCFGSCKYTQHIARYKISQPWSIQVNLADVIPVKTKSLTFSPNPVVAGQPSTATLTLESKTPVDAEIQITSKTSGITPENDIYTIPANSDSISFTVLTGAQGCDPQSATINAYYAEGQNAVLSVNPPSPCPPK